MNDPFQKPPYMNPDGTAPTGSAAEPAPQPAAPAAPLYQAAPEITPVSRPGTEPAPQPKPVLSKTTEAEPQSVFSQSAESQPQNVFGQPATPQPQNTFSQPTAPQPQPGAPQAAPLYQGAPQITPVSQPGAPQGTPETAAPGKGKKGKNKKNKKKQSTVYIRGKVKDTSGAFALTFGILAFLSVGINVFASITAIILAGVSKKHHGYKTVFARIGKALGIISLILFFILAISCIAGYVWLFLYHGHML